MEHVMAEKKRAGRNRTLTLSAREQDRYSKRLVTLSARTTPDRIADKTILQSAFDAIPLLPDSFVDLCIVDPPYNLSKSFNGSRFKRKQPDEYEEWVESWISMLPRILKPDASIYVCCDWRSSSILQSVLEKHFILRNRITWEREKGRGAANNWKNCLEDIWFCTKGAKYYFNTDAVKIKRRVLAPYKDSEGDPKDWKREHNDNYRLTYHSNLWTDITVPFWSMRENTDHPTQKPEKLLAKLILASTKPGGLVFDPFLGSGTTSVTAKKLGRRYTGIESERTYACLAEKRLEAAQHDKQIQGYSDGVFWDRNSLSEQKRGDN
jgi:site-specific DNA-methyltransferase (adenine-specific)